MSIRLDAFFLFPAFMLCYVSGLLAKAPLHQRPDLKLHIILAKKGIDGTFQYVELLLGNWEAFGRREVPRDLLNSKYFGALSLTGTLRLI